MRERAGDTECVCVRERAGDTECVCEREREREQAIQSVCVCV